MFQSQDIETTLMIINRQMDKDDVVYLYNEISLSHKNKNFPFVIMWINLDVVILSETSGQKDRYHIISLKYAIIKTKQTNKQNKTKIDPWIQRTNVW